MTDREPTEDDLPVWAYRKDIGWPEVFFTIIPNGWTHWRPAKDDVPEPPKMELTQPEKDCAACNAWYKKADSVSCLEAWHAALAYEREQVLQLARAIHIWGMDENSRRALEAIRARCGGGAQ